MSYEIGSEGRYDAAATPQRESTLKRLTVPRLNAIYLNPDIIHNVFSSLLSSHSPSPMADRMAKYGSLWQEALSEYLNESGKTLDPKINSAESVVEFVCTHHTKFTDFKAKKDKYHAMLTGIAKPAKAFFDVGRAVAGLVRISQPQPFSPPTSDSF